MATSAKQEMARFWEKNERLNRPVSPHLSIYGSYPPTLTLFSIPPNLSVPTSHFLSLLLSTFCSPPPASVNAAGVSLFAVAALTLPGEFSLYFDVIRSLELPSALIFTGKLAVCFPFAYHTWNGVRHLVWDSGNALKIPQVEMTGYLVVALTLASCLGLASM
ncbi:succinate dehydrogenase cytochrome b560 subunit, mitochondrial [Rhincodon typus]|uniref:succinate dehydrogenase cytochrome b560 subunit, mitochondrial n=1 Tax=Rhincodon typus TaxID=259920 RepID=UPI0020303571|nr:succinate dehydrogenase cytochrome b560 subunit, mitochondrial [Rhincodon typus]